LHGVALVQAVPHEVPVHAWRLGHWLGPVQPQAPFDWQARPLADDWQFVQLPPTVPHSVFDTVSHWLAVVSQQPLLQPPATPTHDPLHEPLLHALPPGQSVAPWQ
jgi:hypothetical protein